MIRYLVVFFCVLFMNASLHAGNYQFFVDLKTVSNYFNSQGPTGIGGTHRMLVRQGGGGYVLRTYHKDEYSNWVEDGYGSPSYISGGLGGGSSLLSNYLGSTFAGYDVEISHPGGEDWVYIYSTVQVVDPAYFANAGNDAYFPTGYIITQSPGCNTGGSGSYSGVFVSMYDFHEYEIGSQDCYDIYDPEATPTPSPSPSPSLSPSPSPAASPPPSLSPTPVSSPFWTPENYPSPVPNVGTLTGSISLDTNGSSTTGSFSATIQMPDTEKLSPYFQSGQSEQNKVNEISNMEISDEVPDVGQQTDLEYGWLDDFLDTLSSHPILAVINGSQIVTSGELCELSCVIFGRTVTFSFCEWSYWFDYLGYFIFVFSLYYAVLIVFLKGS